MPAPISTPPLAPQHLSEMLELEQLDSNLFRSRANQENMNGSLFGGQILGQSMKAAALTVDGARHAHSLHGYFLLAGASDIPVIYDVELTRDGGSFSTRRVVARQRAKTIFHMELSFHRQEEGYEHDVVLDIDVPDPEDLMSTVELAKKYSALLPKDSPPLEHWPSIVEFRPTNPDEFFMRKSHIARGLYWIRSSSPLPNDSVTQLAGAAYLSDYFLLSSALLRHPEATRSEVLLASLDHAMWFHRPCRADDWLLFDTTSPFMGGARGFARGEVYDRQRRLVASVAQEGLVRPMKRS
ncbi:acyl-CoA thioesterase II [Povalibacter sp.]|uniref:acyl-CoA thioesterase n=1 Tax=Povalibacter sp. TaxID=1962978 RepID=UPI002F411EAB